VKITKHFFTVWLILIIFSVSLGFAAPESFKKIAEVKSKAVARVIKKQAKVDKKIEGFVVGKNLKGGMTLDQAITLLGVPKKNNVEREEPNSFSTVILLNMPRMGL
jgi:hypothetical protein